MSDEDAEWLIVKHFDPVYYSIGTKFTETYGPFRGIDQVDDFLRPYALRLGTFEGRTRGFADFGELESGCWLDAMERLRFLEAVCLEANRSVDEALSRIWNAWNDVLVLQASKASDPDDIAPLPESVPRSGPKRRAPLPRTSLSEERTKKAPFN